MLTVRRTDGATSVTAGNADGPLIAQLLSRSLREVPVANLLVVARTKAETMRHDDGRAERAEENRRKTSGNSNFHLLWKSAEQGMAIRPPHRVLCSRHAVGDEALHPRGAQGAGAATGGEARADAGCISRNGAATAPIRRSGQAHRRVPIARGAQTAARMVGDAMPSGSGDRSDQGLPRIGTRPRWNHAEAPTRHGRASRPPGHNRHRDAEQAPRRPPRSISAVVPAPVGAQTR